MVPGIGSYPDPDLQHAQWREQAAGCQPAGQDDALKRVLGSDRIPRTTIGKFLWRFGDDQQDKQRQGLAELRDTTEAVQQEAFGMLPRERRKVATLDWDSSIHEVYGQKKEGRTLRTTIRGATARCTGPSGDRRLCCIPGLREGYRATGQEVLPGTIERASTFEVRMRADSGYYSQALVKICEQREVEFFIVAKQHRNLMNAGGRSRRATGSRFLTVTSGKRQGRLLRRRRRANAETQDSDTAQTQLPVQRSAVAGMSVQAELEQSSRYVIKRTPIVDKDDQQLYLDDGLRRYVYWIVVSNSAQQRAGVANRAGSWQPGEPHQGLVRPAKAGAFSRPAGVRAEPCSLDGRRGGKPRIQPIDTSGKGWSALAGP